MTNTISARCLAELKGIGRLAWFILKAIFWPKGCLYRCPDCNQVISLHQKSCDRCGCPIDWRINS